MLQTVDKLNGMIANLRRVCRGRIYASRGIYPVYRIIGTAVAGGIYAAPTSQPILFIIVYGRGRGTPRPYRSFSTEKHPPLGIRQRAGVGGLGYQAAGSVGSVGRTR